MSIYTCMSLYWQDIEVDWILTPNDIDMAWEVHMYLGALCLSSNTVLNCSLKMPDTPGMR